MAFTYKLDGYAFADMVRSGAVNLRNNAQTVNELNVFPIPDGDTGENMARTIEGGITALAAVDSGDISAVAAELARGMLLSARGNSGVILSQFFEGVRRGLVGVKQAGIKELKVAFTAGVSQAYSAVVQHNRACGGGQRRYFRSGGGACPRHAFVGARQQRRHTLTVFRGCASRTCRRKASGNKGA